MTKNKLKIIKATFGLGKSRLLLNQNNITIGCPTHQLKDELYNRAKNSNIKFYKTPKLNLNNFEYENRYNHLQRIGLFREANGYLRQLAKKGVREVVTYLEEINTIKKLNEGNLLSTQKRIILEQNYHPIANPTIVFDEDVFGELLPTEKMDVYDLYKLINPRIHKHITKAINDCIKIIEKAEVNKPYDYHKETAAIDNEDIKELLEISISMRGVKTNIYDFIIKPHVSFIKYNHGNKQEIQYIRKNTLPSNKQIVIVSATADEHLYQLLCKDYKIKSYDIGLVAPVGKIIQYENYSYSRSSMNQVHYIKLAQLIAGDRNVITYKKYKYLFNNAVGHFFAIRGLDRLNGQDLVICGTPREHPSKYLLYASILGIEFDNIAQTKQICDYNGFKFRFHTFVDENLRRLQFKMIEAELTQAIGRARILRNDCEVIVLSDFPIIGAERRLLTQKEEMELLDKAS